MKHIEFSQLVDRFEGRLAAAENCRVDEHVAACRECSAAGRKLADLFAYTPPAATETVPQATTARILNIFKRKSEPQVTHEPARRGFASLIFDDWQMAVNERYSGIDTRQLLYKFREYDIDLRVDLAGDVASVSGQVFPETIGAVATLSSGDLTISRPLNDLGEFAFEPLPRGLYDLHISAGDHEIVIEQVPLVQ